MADGQWYWCLAHHRPEPYNECRNEVRLGPYASRDEAMGALDKVQARNEEWETDPRWNDPDEDEDDEDGWKR